MVTDLKKELEMKEKVIDALKRNIKNTKTLELEIEV